MNESDTEQFQPDARQLAAEANANAIMNAILTYHQSYERYPASLQELVSVGLLERIPDPPPDSRWVYYPETGTIDFEPSEEPAEQAGPPPPPPGASPHEVEQYSLDTKAGTDLEELRTAIAAYQTQQGRNPASLEELVERGIMRSLPPVPDGMVLSYDPTAGTVEIKRR